MHSVEIRKAVNAHDVAQQAALEVLQYLRDFLATQDSVHLALTGGSVGIKTLEAMAVEPGLMDIDFARLHIWWGDERYLASDSVDRNANQAKDALLRKIAVPSQNIHEFPATDSGLTVAQSAEAFEAELIGIFNGKQPAMDLTILGMGPDGHIASLFPGHVHLNNEIVFVENSPKPPSERLSFNYSLLNRSKKVVFVVSGIDKAEAIEQIHTQENCELPAAKITSIDSTTWFIDEAAGSGFWSC